jgi:hypothetical protein
MRDIEVSRVDNVPVERVYTRSVHVRWLVAVVVVFEIKLVVAGRATFPYLGTYIVAL